MTVEARNRHAVVEVSTRRLPAAPDVFAEVGVFRSLRAALAAGRMVASEKKLKPCVMVPEIFWISPASDAAGQAGV